MSPGVEAWAVRAGCCLTRRTPAETPPTPRAPRISRWQRTDVDSRLVFERAAVCRLDVEEEDDYPVKPVMCSQRIPEGAARALAEAMREPGEAYRLWVLAIVHEAMGNGEESVAALRELIEKYAKDSAYQVAEVQVVR